MASQQKTPTILCKYANLYAKIVHVTNKQTCTSPHYIVFIMNTVTKTKDMQITLQQQHNAAPTLTARFTAQQYTKYQHTISHSDHIYKTQIQNLNKCLICHYTHYHLPSWVSLLSNFLNNLMLPLINFMAPKYIVWPQYYNF